MQQRLMFVGLADLVVIAIAYLLWDALNLGNAIVGGSIVAVGLITLFGLLSANTNQTKVTGRFAIAVTLIVLWLAVIGAYSFVATAEDETLIDEAFQSITLAVSVVLAFYFGAQVFQAVAGKAAETEEEAEKDPTDDPGGSHVESLHRTVQSREVWD